MSAAQVLEQARALGIVLCAVGGKLRYEAPAGRLTPELRATLAAHKPAILAALAYPDALWWRVAILEPGGRTVEVDTPSGWTLVDWQAYAERYHAPGCAVTPIAGLPKPRTSVRLDEALRAACDGVAGITPAQFQALLSPEDIDDIAAGAIHSKTLQRLHPVIRRGDTVRADRGTSGEGGRQARPRLGQYCYHRGRD